MKQVRKEKPAPQKQEEVVEELPPAQETDATEAIDDILDAIDEVLEENAQEFVTNYVQKGGE